MNQRKFPRAAGDDRIADVLVIGAGFSGLGVTVRLQQEGIDDIVILERADDVGGTWRDNNYPGAACDIPSNLYSYSFAQNPDWSRSYPSAGEIHAYIRRFADERGLTGRIRFGHNVTDVSFADDHWRVQTGKHGVFRARALVMAAGPLANASLPKITGIDDFKGKKIHSARWDHSYDFRGKRVAVIGTGASAIQLVPELVKQVDQLKVFQRTPAWILPRADFKTPGWNKALFKRFPRAQNAVREALFWGHESAAAGVIWHSPLTSLLERTARSHLHRQVKDTWLRRQLQPDYRIGCKRVLISNDWYPALQQPNAKLITWPIVRLRPDGIQTAEGAVHAVDCIVFATGFEVGKAGTAFPVHGLDGVELGALWKRGASAYKSINIAGFPNLFMTAGPNAGPGHNSYLYYMEAQFDYTVDGIKAILANDLAQLDVRPAVQTAYNQQLQQRLAKTNWNSGCKSWYLTEDGFNATMFPGFATQYARQMHSFTLADYRQVARKAVREAVAKAS
jgi:cation diffusion facilitator CzcD-associated flavoprotein CzcO